MREFGFPHTKFAGRIAALVCALIAAAGASARASAVAPATYGRIAQVLSNETTFTRWAYVSQTGSIYRAPSTSSARIPGRPNGRTGWVERDELGPFHLTHLLVVVNRERLRMYFYDRGRQIWSAPIGVGKPSTPTPAGHFWIVAQHLKLGTPLHVV